MSAAELVPVPEPQPESRQMQTYYNLYACINTVLDTCDVENPYQVAREVARRVPSESLRQALCDALMMSRLSFRREYDDEPIEPVQAPMPGPSRFTGIGQVYLAYLNSKVAVAGIFKRRGDCTRDDVRSIGEHFMDRAREYAKEARREQLLAAAMEKHEASVVSDVPEPVVLEILRWQP